MTIIGISTLSQAVDMLREDLAIANSSVLSERERAGHAERQLEMERQLVEDGRKRIDELQALLPAGRRQIDTLYVDLADARTAALITGCEAAALRAQADERRSWRLLRRLRWALRGEWAAMNLRRGLLRFWMVCSIAWIAFVSIDAIRYWSLSWTLSDSPVRIARDVARDWESSIRPHLEWAFGPPVVVLIVGAALWWAIAGFPEIAARSRPWWR
jgi:hypothetical protein